MEVSSTTNWKELTMNRRLPAIAAVLLASGVVASSDALASTATNGNLAADAPASAHASVSPEDGRHRRSFDRFLDRFEAANSAFVNGDPSPWLSITTDQEPASIFGGFGGLGSVGVADANQRYLLAASAFQPSGAEVTFDYLVKDVQGTYAYTVAIERAEVLYTGHSATQPQVLRVTMMFRFERGEWKIVHRHADDMVDLELPTP